MSAPGVRELPVGWGLSRLGEVVDLLDHLRVPINSEERAQRKGPIPYYGATGQIGWIDDFLFDEELVLLGEDGAPFLEPSKPKAYIIWGKSWVNNHAHVLRAKSGILNKFLMHQLNQIDFNPFVSGTTRLKLPQAPLRTIPVAVAPEAEQQRIVAEIEKQFTRLNAAVAALRRIQANLKRYRTSVLKAACEGRLVQTEAKLARREGRDYEPADRLLARILEERRATWEADQLAKMQAAGKPPKDDKWRAKYQEPTVPDISDRPELPEGWTWASVEQLGMVQLGRQRSPKNRSKDHPVQYLRAANITEAGLDLSDVYDMEFSPKEQERYRLRNGDLLLSEASGSSDQVGKPAIWRDQLPMCCFQNTVIRLRPVLDLSNYLLICFRSYYASGVFAKTAGGVGINHLSAERFSRIVVPLGPICEQGRIVAEVERRLSTIDELESLVKVNLNRAERLRQAILKRAFEGKLVPQDPNDEPAGALLERICAERAKAQQARASRGERSRRTTSRGQRTKAEL